MVKPEGEGGSDSSVSNRVKHLHREAKGCGDTQEGHAMVKPDGAGGSDNSVSNRVKHLHREAEGCGDTQEGNVALLW